MNARGSYHKQYWLFRCDTVQFGTYLPLYPSADSIFFRKSINFVLPGYKFFGLGRQYSQCIYREVKVKVKVNSQWTL